MGHLSSEAFGGILDHLADVIEGGNAYRGGDSYRGVPGTHSNDEGLRVGSDGSFLASGTPTTTAVQHPTGTWGQSRWVKASTPGFFLVDDVQGAARRITAWDRGSKTFTVDAFPSAPAAGRAMTIRQGFKRMPNHIDIETDDAGADGGYDRAFSLLLNPGVDAGLYGQGNITRRGELELRLRVLKYDRAQDARQSVVENIALLTTALRMGGVAETPNHRDGTYIRAILSPQSDPEYSETDSRFVAIARLPLVYRISTTFA
jgi:hypothetical protein